MYYELDDAAYEQTETFRQEQAAMDATHQFCAGYYGYLAGTADFPTNAARPEGYFEPADFDNPPDDDPELARACRVRDWFSLGMVAARRQLEGENFVPVVLTEESARAGRHALHVVMAADKNPGSALPSLWDWTTN